VNRPNLSADDDVPVVEEVTPVHDDRGDAGGEPLHALAASVRRLLADDEVGGAQVALTDLLGTLDPDTAVDVGGLVASAPPAEDAGWPAAVDVLLAAIEQLNE